MNEPNATPPATQNPDDREEAVEGYREYNRVLRTWFVALGVGGPALFL